MNEAEALRTHEKKIRSLATRGCGPGVDPDDLLQEARIAFLLAARTWRGDNGACLWTLARRRIETALIRARQKAYKDRVVPGGAEAGMSIEHVRDEGLRGETRVTPEDVAIARQEIDALSAERRAAVLAFRDVPRGAHRARYLLRSGLCLIRTGRVRA